MPIGKISIQFSNKSCKSINLVDHIPDANHWLRQGCYEHINYIEKSLNRNLKTPRDNLIQTTLSESLNSKKISTVDFYKDACKVLGNRGRAAFEPLHYQ